MADQLFRFCVLRGPELAPKLIPIIVGKENGAVDDSLVPIAARANTWIKSHTTLDAATFRDLEVTLAFDPGILRPQATAGLTALAKRQVAQALLALVHEPSQANRRTFVDATDSLTAAAIVADFKTQQGTKKILEWVKEHPIQIDFDHILPAGLWRPRRALVRAPAVSKHFVVREELVGYEMGEIEDIKNYLKGELKDHSLRYLAVNEHELVTESETQNDRTTETATQQRSSMKSATQTTANSTIGLDARVKTDGQYGPTKVSSDVGFQYSSTNTEANQTAAEFSSDVLQKSVEEVRDRELTRITTRTRTELEEKRDHKVDNVGGAGHIIGIYRWVNSRWKATTHDVGLRLVLEFLIPEPGRPVLVGKQPVKSDKDPGRPPDLPKDLYDKLDGADSAKQVAELAALYGVDGIKALPIDKQRLGIPFTSTDMKDAAGERILAVVVKDLKIPDKYIAKDVVVTVTAMDRPDVDDKSNIVIDLPGFEPQHFLDNPALPNPFEIPPGLGRPTSGLRSLVVQRQGFWGPGATVPIAVYTEDVRSFTGTVEVFCELSQSAKDEWKLDTLQKIVAAYRTRLAESESNKLAQSFDLPPPQPAPDLEALCRHACISSLLGKWPPAAPARNDGGGWPVPGALANETGELIEFMEQAFEWNNLQYVAYPYYWADAKSWPELLKFDDPDSHVREFVRSGAVRMVVPVRLDLSEAVMFFLATGLPWFGGAAPIPGETGYLAIADEIRNSRVTSNEEPIVGEFRYSLPTSLTILQKTGVLPTEPGA
jgi:hypothetical protein